MLAVRHDSIHWHKGVCSQSGMHHHQILTADCGEISAPHIIAIPARCSLRCSRCHVSPNCSQCNFPVERPLRCPLRPFLTDEMDGQGQARNKNLSPSPETYWGQSAVVPELFSVHHVHRHVMLTAQLCCGVIGYATGAGSLVLPRS
jgi:hypothetical protein